MTRGEDPVLFAEPHNSEEVFNQHDFPERAELQIAAGAADDLDRPDSPVETCAIIVTFCFRNSSSSTFHTPP